MKMFLFRYRLYTDTWLGRGVLIQTEKIDTAWVEGMRAVRTLHPDEATTHVIMEMSIIQLETIHDTNAYELPNLGAMSPMK